MKKPWLIGMGAILLAGGVAFSVYDYKQWRYEETKNYGHGPAVTRLPAEDVSVKYQNSIVGIRMKYPMNWIMTENAKLKVVPTGKPAELEQVLVPEKLAEVAKWNKPNSDVELVLEVERKDISTVDRVNYEIDLLKKKNISLDRERESLNTERESWVEINWNEGGRTYRNAILGKKGRVVTFTISMPDGQLDAYLATFEEVVRRATMTF